jgi:hypothetical protein
MYTRYVNEQTENHEVLLHVSPTTLNTNGYLNESPKHLEENHTYQFINNTPLK